MKQLILSIALTGALIVSTFADPQNLDSSNLAVQGYDTVAYFVDHKAEKGQDLYHVEYQGATYLFATKEHAELFAKNPAKYVPQFGGYCAYGVSCGRKAPISPDAFQIIDGKLYLQYDTDILEEFNKDPKNNLNKAQTNWPKIVAESK